MSDDRGTPTHIVDWESLNDYDRDLILANYIDDCAAGDEYDAWLLRESDKVPGFKKYRDQELKEREEEANTPHPADGQYD